MASSPARALGEQAPVALPADLPAHLTASLVADLDDGDAAVTSSLAAALAAVPDARDRRGRRHELTGVLTIGACACLTGATSYVAIGEWADTQGQAVLDCLDEQPVPRALPCEATLRRCLQTTDSAALDAAVAGWAVGQLAAQQALAAGATVDLVSAAAGRRVIAIDGKTLRGSAPRAAPEQLTAAAHGGGRTPLVAAFDHASGVTLGQVACAPEAGTGGEVVTAKQLAAALDERGLLAGSVVPPSTPGSPPASSPPSYASGARTGFCPSRAPSAPRGVLTHPRMRRDRLGGRSAGSDALPESER